MNTIVMSQVRSSQVQDRIAIDVDWVEALIGVEMMEGVEEIHEEFNFILANT